MRVGKTLNIGLWVGLFFAVFLSSTLRAQAGPHRTGGEVESHYDQIIRLAEGADPVILTNAFFGPAGSNELRLSGGVAVPVGHESWSARLNSFARTYCSQTCRFAYRLDIPSGAVITRIQGNIRDNNNNGEVWIELVNCAINSAKDCTYITHVTSGGNEETGDAIISRDLSYPVANEVGSLALLVDLTGGNSTTAFKNFKVIWKRQISPAPGVASFSDVPVGAAFFREIEALAASGVTSGCGAGVYCPQQYVTRGQMAAFLARALGL